MSANHKKRKKIERGNHIFEVDTMKGDRKNLKKLINYDFINGLNSSYSLNN